MGQAKRRAIEIALLKCENARGIPIDGVHEAGHVFGRFITAELMGVEPAVAVGRVEMHQPDTAPRLTSPDGREYMIAATTYGPFYSREIEEVSIAVNERYGVDFKGDPQRANAIASGADYQRDLIKAARAAGANISNWAVGRIVQNLAGPAAEARIRRKPFYEVARSIGCADDMAAVLRVGRLVGWSDEQIDICINNVVDYLDARWSDPPYWTATLAVARHLPREGVVTGAECWKLFRESLAKAGVRPNFPSLWLCLPST